MAVLNTSTGSSVWLAPWILKPLKEWLLNSCCKCGNLKCVILLNCQLLLIIFMQWITSAIQSQWTWGYAPPFEELWRGTASVSAVKFLLVKFASSACTAADKNRSCCTKLESFHNIFSAVFLTGQILVLKLFYCLQIGWKSVSVAWHKLNVSCVIWALRMAWGSLKINRLSVFASFSLYF